MESSALRHARPPENAAGVDAARIHFTGCRFGANFDAGFSPGHLVVSLLFV